MFALTEQSSELQFVKSSKQERVDTRDPAIAHRTPRLGVNLRKNRLPNYAVLRVVQFTVTIGERLRC